MGCSGGFNASFVALTTDRNVEVTLCSRRHRNFVVKGCRKVGGCGVKVDDRKAKPSCHSES